MLDFYVTHVLSTHPSAADSSGLEEGSQRRERGCTLICAEKYMQLVNGSLWIF